MKKFIRSIISVVLTLSLTLGVCTPAFAASYENPNTYEIEVSSEERINQSLSHMYDNLSPDAQELFVRTIYDDPVLWGYFVANVSNDSIIINPTTRAANPLDNLRQNLNNLMLPTAVVTSLLLVGSGLVAATADGPLVFGDAYLIVVTAGAAVTLGIYWNVVAPAFPSIVSAFTQVFSDSVDVIVSLFNQLASDAEAEAEEETERRIDDVLDDKTKDHDTMGNTHIYDGEGGYEAAEEDFNKLNEGEVTEYANGTKVGHLPDGTTINVRPQSSDGRPTLEIQGSGQHKIKIRYN